MNCTLCKSTDTNHIYSSKNYTYINCQTCDLVFVNPDERLQPADEKHRYDQHENDPNDKEYRLFLDQLFTPLRNKIKPGSYGLDFGSGPGPTLSIMFEEVGHRMEIYDPFYAKNPSVLTNSYDFITSTETVEHFYHPDQEFKKLWSLLTHGGYLGIMTLLRPENKPLSEWHYIRDDTHVTFYTKRTFRWIAENYNAKVWFHGDRVIILQKAFDKE